MSLHDEIVLKLKRKYILLYVCRELKEVRQIHDIIIKIKLLPEVKCV